MDLRRCHLLPDDPAEQRRVCSIQNYGYAFTEKPVAVVDQLGSRSDGRGVHEVVIVWNRIGDREAPVAGCIGERDRAGPSIAVGSESAAVDTVERHAEVQLDVSQCIDAGGPAVALTNLERSGRSGCIDNGLGFRAVHAHKAEVDDECRHRHQREEAPADNDHGDSGLVTEAPATHHSARSYRVADCASRVTMRLKKKNSSAVRRSATTWTLRSSSGRPSG